MSIETNNDYDDYHSSPINENYQINEEYLFNQEAHPYMFTNFEGGGGNDFYDIGEDLDEESLNEEDQKDDDDDVDDDDDDVDGEDEIQVENFDKDDDYDDHSDDNDDVDSIFSSGDGNSESSTTRTEKDILYNGCLYYIKFLLFRSSSLLLIITQQ